MALFALHDDICSGFHDRATIRAWCKYFGWTISKSSPSSKKKHNALKRKNNSFYRKAPVWTIMEKSGQGLS